MQIYLVGGAVRDALLGLDVTDHDWVVVGATPEQMVAQGFLPVGKDFPVFLHPSTHEEYALARTERKTAPGYKGFIIHAAPDVTLAQDLARRDLTINSIAINELPARAGGTFDLFLGRKPAFQPDLTALIDPHNGQQDLRNKVLRHVTDAFREDPVRILRVARFAARFADFSVAPETMQLMHEMVAHGEADHLVAERVWQEISNGLMTPRPSRMIDILAQCGALARLLPGFQWQAGATATALDNSAESAAPLCVRYACLYQPGAGFDAWRVPTDCNALAELADRECRSLDNSQALDAQGLMQLLERCDAIRQPARFANLLLAFACGAHVKCRLDNTDPAADQKMRQAVREHLLAALTAAQAVATQPIAARAQADGASGPRIGEMIRAARREAVAHWLAMSASAP